jgi:hypothetical protein
MWNVNALLQRWSAAQSRWDDRRKRKLVKKTASALRKVDPMVPFVSRYTLQKDQPVSSEMDIKRIDGLLSLHVVQERDQKELIAYWKSRDHFEKSGAPLERALQAPIKNQGLLSEVFLTPKRWHDWLTPQNIWTGVATIVAAISTIEALRNDYSWLLGKPNVTVAESEGTKNFRVGEPIIIDRKILNTGRCNARIEVRKRRVVDQDGRKVSDTDIEMSKDILEMAELEPNKSDVFPIRAKGLKAGIFEIEYRGRLTNGWARQE